MDGLTDRLDWKSGQIDRNTIRTVITCYAKVRPEMTMIEEEGGDDEIEEEEKERSKEGTGSLQTDGHTGKQTVGRTDRYYSWRQVRNEAEVEWEV